MFLLKTDMEVPAAVQTAKEKALMVDLQQNNWFHNFDGKLEHTCSGCQKSYLFWIGFSEKWAPCDEL
jgi:hypothetical protein